MNSSELNTEQIILAAAEAEFLEKGYGNAKMMAIAKRANVAHSMLHYYFRSKENLFQKVFLEKAQTISSSFEDIFEQHLSFFETVRILMETQFDFIAKNRELPRFILTEIVTNKENRTLLFDILALEARYTMSKIQTMLEAEIEKGTVRPIHFRDFFLNLISINISSFIALPIIQDLGGLSDKSLESMLAERRESNVQFILAALKP